MILVASIIESHFVSDVRPWIRSYNAFQLCFLPLSDSVLETKPKRLKNENVQINICCFFKLYGGLKRGAGDHEYFAIYYLESRRRRDLGAA